MKPHHTTLLDRLYWLANRGELFILALAAVGVVCGQLRRLYV